MAKKTTLQNIPLSTNLNLDTLQTTVENFEGMLENNATLYNGGLTPFRNTVGSINPPEQLFINKQGEQFRCYPDGTVNSSQMFNADGFKRTELDITSDYYFIGGVSDLEVEFFVDVTDLEISITAKSGSTTKVTKVDIDTTAYLIDVAFISEEVSGVGLSAFTIKSQERNQSRTDVTLVLFDESGSSVLDKLTGHTITYNNVLDNPTGICFPDRLNGKSYFFISLTAESPCKVLTIENGAVEGYAVVFEYFGESTETVGKRFPTIYCKGHLYLNPEDLDDEYEREYITYTTGTIASIDIVDATATLNVVVNPSAAFKVGDNVGSFSKDVFVYNYDKFIYELYYTYSTEDDAGVTKKRTVFMSSYIDEQYLLFNTGETVDGNIPNYGKRFNVSDFNFIYKNGVIAGISYSQNSSLNTGTLLTEWNTLSTTRMPSTYNNSVVFKEEYGKYYRIDIVSNDLDYLFLDNRYIISTTKDYLNAYDTIENKLFHYATDYNDFFVGGFYRGSVSMFVNKYNLLTETLVSLNNIEGIGSTIATGVNAITSITKNPFISIQNNPQIIFQMYNDYLYPSGYGYNNQSVDIFRTNDSQAVAPEYAYSYEDGKRFIQQELLSQVYPIELNGNILFNLDIFAKIKKSYTNADLVVLTRGTAPLIYQNFKEIFGFYLLSKLENLTDLFVIQGQNFIISEDVIFAVSYSGGTVSSSTAVLDITGMIFLGSNTKEAIFFSPSDGYVYSFTGDRVMAKLYSASSITDVYHYWYNTSTYTLIISTNIGTIFFSDRGVFKVDKIAESYAQDLEGFFLIYTDDTFESFKYLEGDYSPLKFKTKYYGLGNNQVSTVDCWYLRLFDKERRSGKISLKVSTITDTATTTEKKDVVIKENSWDENNCFYVRYQPKYQRAVGVSLEVESDFSVYSLSCSVSTEGTAQVSGVNI